MKKRLILIGFLTLFLAAGILVYWAQHKEHSAELYYSGSIEATQADLAFQVSGRVQAVRVEEGEPVDEGRVLAVLDRREFVARRDGAKAELRRAQENLKRLEHILVGLRSSLPAEVERAQAAVRGHQAQLEQLEAGYRSQEVERARLASQEARAAMEDARKDKGRFDRLFQQGIVAERDRDAADLRYEAALRRFERERASYALLKEGFRKEAIASARAKLAESRAALKQARGNLKQIEATEREVLAARAQVEAARAALSLAGIRLAYTELRAPFDGIVVSRNVELGEVVTPGQEVLSVADLSKVDLKIFVDETEIGKVKPGQAAHVKTDTFPSKTYVGRVSFISPEGEFTPKIIQTHKERVKLVYLVKITIPNPDMELKPGMPADAWFR